jgi:hypothetical protein
VTLKNRLSIVVTVVCGLWMLGTSAASGDALSLSVSPTTPEQGVPATFTFTGNAASVEKEGGGPNLLVEYRPTGGLGCQASFENDRQAAGGASTVLAGSGSNRAPWDTDSFDENPPTVGPGEFSVPFTYGMPAPGSYLMCAYLESRSQAEGEAPHVEASTNITIQVTPPRVSAFTVAFPAGAQPGQTFAIDYTTQTDQQLDLLSVVRLAGGLPCAASPELDEQENQTEDRPTFAHEGYDFEDNKLQIFGGPVTNQATDTETLAGPHIVCSWITGPNSGEIDAALTTPFYVGTPPAPPQGPSAACLRDRRNVSYDVGVIHRYQHALKSRHLSHKRRRADQRILSRARRSLHGNESLRHNQCPGGR